jgi:hypothetical protein
VSANLCAAGLAWHGGTLRCRVPQALACGAGQVWDAVDLRCLGTRPALCRSDARFTYYLGAAPGGGGAAPGAPRAPEPSGALASLLGGYGAAPAGALVFSCNGRGTRLFAEASHDARCLQDMIGPVPAAGFFAQGEIGPIGRRNCLHGFTASIALFEQGE